MIIKKLYISTDTDEYCFYFTFDILKMKYNEKSYVGIKYLVI